MGKPRPANGTAVPTPLTERRGESPSRRPHGDGRSAQTGDLPGGNGVVSTPVREESAPDVGFRPRIPSIPRRNDAAVPKVRYTRSEFLAMTLRDIGPEEDG